MAKPCLIWWNLGKQAYSHASLLWNVFHGSHGSPRLLVFKHWSVGNCVKRAPPQSGSPVSPPSLDLLMEQSSLQGVEPVPARQARQQEVITGEQRVWFDTGKKENGFTGTKMIGIEETLGDKSSVTFVGWNRSCESYGGKRWCESVRGSFTKPNGIASALTAVDGSILTLFCRLIFFYEVTYRVLVLRTVESSELPVANYKGPGCCFF